MRAAFRIAFAGLLVWALAAPSAHAQTGPSPAEVAQFSALHAAAHRGDLVRLASALAGGAPVNGRDSHGRTPLHVATFARQREAIRRLAAAGADPGRSRTTDTTR